MESEVKSEEMTLYEVATEKKVQAATVKNAVKNGRLKVHREAPVGKTRTLPMFLRENVEKWNPQVAGNTVRKAAKLLGIDEDVASELKARYERTGKENIIEIVEGE